MMQRLGRWNGIYIRDAAGDATFKAKSEWRRCRVDDVEKWCVDLVNVVDN